MSERNQYQLNTLKIGDVIRIVKGSNASFMIINNALRKCKLMNLRSGQLARYLGDTLFTKVFLVTK